MPQTYAFAWLILRVSWWRGIARSVGSEKCRKATLQAAFWCFLAWWLPGLATLCGTTATSPSGCWNAGNYE
ncbi:hypothetical protein ACLB1Q_21055 [Escherichia coli]